MKNLRIFGLVIFLFALSCSKDNPVNPIAPAQDPVRINLQLMVNDLDAAYRAKYPGFPGGLAVKVITGKGEWFVSSGMPAGTGSNVHFRAASVTKTFTATAILLLMQEGKLRLDDKITDTIPGKKITYVPSDGNYAIPYKNLISIRQLLQNKAGVFDLVNSNIPDTVSVPVPYKGKNYLTWVQDSDPYHTFSFDELVGVVATCRLFYFRPGTGYHYSNTGYSILGKIIERVSGQSYAEYVTGHVLMPMGLTGSSLPFLGNDTAIPQPFVGSFYYMPGIQDVTSQNVSANVAEGNLITTPDDLARFARHLFRGQGVLSSYTVNAEMLKPLVPPDTMQIYLCGVEYYRNLGYGHGGNMPAYNTMMISDPVNDFTCVVFINAWNLSTGGNSGLIEQVKSVLLESCYRSMYITRP